MYVDMDRLGADRIEDESNLAANSRCYLVDAARTKSHSSDWQLRSKAHYKKCTKYNITMQLHAKALSDII